VTGPLPAGQAWERYVVPANWPRWAPHIRTVDVDADRLAPGVTGRINDALGVHVSFLVTAVDERRRTWAWDARVGPVRMHLRHGVEEHPRGSATWLTVRGPAVVVVPYLPLARLALRRLVRPLPA
jgi:hypothetical protein